MARTQLINASAIDIEADDRRTGAREGDRDRKAHVAEADHGDFASMGHYRIRPRNVAKLCPSLAAVDGWEQ